MCFRRMWKASDSQHAESVNGRRSQSAACTSTYDVFINHRGPDTKLHFVTHLVDALKDKNLNPFVDRSIEEGKNVFEEIEAAIQRAPVLLAIFSPGYAESEYCLKELVAMLKRREDNPAAVTVVPVFFNVRPRDLRCAGSSPDNPFYAAFEEHKRSGLKKPITDWATALGIAADVMGFVLADYKEDTNELKKRIVTRVEELVRPRSGLGSTSKDNRQITESSEIAYTPPPRAQQEDSIRLGSGLSSTSQDNRQIIDSSEIAHTPTPRAQHEDVRSPLTILVIGNSADGVVEYFCGGGMGQTLVPNDIRNAADGIVNCPRGEGRRQTSVQNFARSCIYFPPMFLYSYVSNANDLMRALKTFMASWKKRWSGECVVDSCLDRINQRSQEKLPSNHSATRLHMVWLVCQRCSDLPNIFQWKEIVKTLSDLPIQIVVIPGGATRETLDLEYTKILKRGTVFFQKSQNLEQLILKLDLRRGDRDLKENLWRTCWKAKIQAEIANAASIIRKISKELGSKGISVSGNVGNPDTPPEVSLSVGGKFLLDFWGKYWEVPKFTLEGVQNELRPYYDHRRLKIRPYQFVRFSLQAAAIILYNMPDYENLNDRNWRDITSECKDKYFYESDKTYDKMGSITLQAFLLDVFERNDFRFQSMEGEQRLCCLY